MVSALFDSRKVLKLQCTSIITQTPFALCCVWKLINLVENAEILQFDGLIHLSPVHLKFPEQPVQSTARQLSVQ